MPKNKRERVVSLTSTQKTPYDRMEHKKALVTQIRAALETYSSLYVFTTHNARGENLKQVRNQWKDSRFFLGKNKVMMLALGRNEESEVEQGLCEVGKLLVGSSGLLFTNRPRAEVVRWFKAFSVDEFARGGFSAPRDITLQPGVLRPDNPFPSSAEPLLRDRLGLPVSVVDGAIQLLREYPVCTAGTALTPEQAKILELLGLRTCTFTIQLICHWSKETSCTML
eukprot:gnl/Hemi2/25328_TR8527_c0_g1_i1.p1 gnl/Hemi2/25328_TR8527_c0_g1~~gnl/Hemi2/25328_TR8527_c0_g1_i1.p1  ORF type:complete len:225 (-),score=12.67 gnl/Hemi2/25328_TR8527_c0_g1_i1:94-768(-)